MFQTPFADQVRNEGRVTTMAVGNIYEPDHVNSILAAGRADLVALARPHLIDPSWTLRAAAQPGLSPRRRPAALSRRHGPARPQSAARSGAQGMRLAGRHAIVTGGGTGIGAAIAGALAAEGADASAAGSAVAPCESRAGDRLRLRYRERVFVAADVTDRAQVDAAFAAARETARPDLDPRQQCRRRAGRALRQGDANSSGARCWRSISTACSIAARRRSPICSPPKPGGSSPSPRWRASTASPTPRPISPPSMARSA